MADRVFKPEVEKENVSVGAPDEFLDAWERADLYLPVATEVSPMPAESRVVAYSDPKSAGADKFRLVQLLLKSLQTARKLKTLLITSALPGDGKSTVALNLATVLSENGKLPVLLVEADVYRPTLARKLGLKPWPGLIECYKHGSDPMLAIRRIEPLGFYLLPAGQATDDSGGLLQDNFGSQLVKGLSSSFFSWILIDSPPTTPIADILTLKAQVDGTLLVARAGATPREALQESVQNLGRDHVVGIVLNAVEGIERAYSKYYGYGKTAGRGKPAASGSHTGLGLNPRTR